MENEKNLNTNEVVDSVNDAQENEGQALENEKATDIEQLKKELEEKIKAEYQKEIDRRITDAVKKRERALKAEFEEKERLLKMTEEERLKEEERKRIELQQQKERELNLRELKLNLIDEITSQGLDFELKDIIPIDDIANIEDSEERVATLKDRVKQYNTVFKKLLDKHLEDFKKQLLTGETPAKVKGDNTPLNEYEQAIRNKDASALLRLKFQKKD